AYYTHVQTGNPLYDFYFDVELMPGYGWIFPTGDHTANIGIGILPIFWSPRKSISVLLEAFIQRRIKEGILKPDIRLDGPVKGYPLRICYPHQRVAGKNWVIVGEAAGLVNPVTGEGIDLAMESALIAARTMDEDIRKGRRTHIAYQRELWDRFGSLFTGLRALRDIMVTPIFTDYALWLMNVHPFITRTVMAIAQGFAPPQDVFHPKFVMQFFVPISPRVIAEGYRHIKRSQQQ
nr:NAD(P)/FAD-dependent oxidoreductase [Anaerolineae bacterium]